MLAVRFTCSNPVRDVNLTAPDWVTAYVCIAAQMLHAIYELDASGYKMSPEQKTHLAQALKEIENKVYENAVDILSDFVLDDCEYFVDPVSDTDFKTERNFLKMMVKKANLLL